MRQHVEDLGAEQQPTPPAQERVEVRFEPGARVSVRVSVHERQAAIGQYVCRLVRSGWLARVAQQRVRRGTRKRKRKGKEPRHACGGAATLAVLLCYLESSNGAELAATGELRSFEALYRDQIMDRTGESAGSVDRAIRALKRAGLVDVIRTGGGRLPSRFKLLPPPAEDSPIYHGGKVRHGGASLPAGGEAACAPARKLPARQRASCLRASAQAQRPDLINTSIENNTTNTTATAAAGGGGAGEDGQGEKLAPLAAELVAAGVWRDRAAELVKLPTTTAELVRRARARVASSRGVKDRGALLANLVANPHRLDVAGDVAGVEAAAELAAAEKERRAAANAKARRVDAWCSDQVRRGQLDALKAKLLAQLDAGPLRSMFDRQVPTDAQAVTLREMLYDKFAEAGTPCHG